MGQPRFLDAPEITEPGRSPDLPGHGSLAYSPHSAGKEVTQAPRRPAGSPGVSPSPAPAPGMTQEEARSNKGTEQPLRPDFLEEIPSLSHSVVSSISLH